MSDAMPRLAYVSATTLVVEVHLRRPCSRSSQQVGAQACCRAFSAEAASSF
jgi:hypothetical protein